MPQPPPTLYIRSPRGEIAYQRVGEGAIDVLMVHGMGRSVENVWDYPPMAAVLERIARFSRLVLFDRRGTGISDPIPTDQPPTWEDWGDDIRTVLDALGIQRAALIAERDAGGAAVTFAATHPDRVSALVLGNASARVRIDADYPFGLSDERVGQLHRFFADSWGTERFFSMSPGSTDDAAHLRWRMRSMRVTYTPRRAAEEFLYTFGLDTRSVLSAVQCPTLVLHRRGYPLMSVEHSEYLARHIKNARLEVLPGNETLVLMPGDMVVPDLIEEFLTGSRSAALDERLLATVLFTDIAGSTERAAALGDAGWRALQSRHHELVRAELATHRGREIDTAGDGFFAAFDGPARAVRCAQSIRTRLARELGVDIRAGLHTGECERAGAGLSGLAVHIGARIMALAAPGELLASQTVRDLVTGSGLRFREAGQHSLKGVPGQWPLYAAESAD